MLPSLAQSFSRAERAAKAGALRRACLGVYNAINTSQPARRAQKMANFLRQIR
jgi:hypothetical protein